MREAHGGGGPWVLWDLEYVEGSILYSGLKLDSGARMVSGLQTREKCVRRRWREQDRRRAFLPFLCYNRKAEVEQEPQKTKLARNLKSSPLTRIAQQHHHESLSQRILALVVEISQQLTQERTTRYR